MLSKKSKERYHVEINYDTSSVLVAAIRDGESYKQIMVVPPSLLERMLGATLDKRIRTAAQNMQRYCDDENVELDKMKDACETAESPMEM